MRTLWLALLLAIPAQAQRTGEVGFTIDQWGGIDTQHDSSRIGDFDAQEADNVLTDSGRLDKRTGNTRLTTILSGYQNKALREFVPASLTRYVIAHASNTVYATDLGGSVTALSTVTAGSNVDMAQGLNKLIVQDGTATPWSWDATSTAALSGMPVCKYIEYANERIYCGNLPNASTSRVAVSSYGSVSYFTVPANVAAVAEAPNTFDFQREDGDVVTCLKATRLGMFVGKRRSTHIIKGYDNFTFRKDVISENIGCQDDRSVQTVDGNIVWLGQDAVYSWAGAGRPEAISRDIDPIIKSLRQGDSFSEAWVLNSQADFESGNLIASGAGAQMSSTIEAGSVTPSSATLLSNTTTLFSLDSCDGCSVNNNNYIEFAGIASTYVFRYEGDILPASDGWALSSGGGFSESVAGSSLTARTTNAAFSYSKAIGDGTNGLSFVSRFGVATENFGNCLVEILRTAPSSALLASVTVTSNTIAYGTNSGADLQTQAQISYSTFTVIITTASSASFYRNGTFISSRTANVAGTANTAFVICTPNAPAPASVNLFLDFVHVASGATVSGTSNIVSISTYTTRIFDTGVSTPTFGLLSISSFPEAGTNLIYSIRTSTSPNNDLWSSYAILAEGGQPANGGSRYAQLRSTFSALNLVESPGFNSVRLSANTTGYYFSPIKFIGTAISTYGVFDAQENIPSGGSISYSVRQATYSFPAATSGIAWTAISNHASVPISVSTPAYFQYRSLFSPTNGDQVVVLRRSELAWTEGTVAPPVSSGWKDGRYFLCATISASAIYPDKCLVYQRNHKWTTFSGFSAASITPYSNYLIIGSGGTDSYVWRMLQNDIYNDDGSAIAATWISKDFMFAPNGRDWPVGTKNVNEVWLDTKVSSSTYLSVGYAVNKSTTYMSDQLDLGAWGDTVNKLMPFTTTNYGKYMRLKLYNADLDKAINVNGYSIYGEPNPKTQD